MITIDKLRGRSWSRSYLWEVLFKDAPEPYSEFFPAVDVEEPVFDISTHDFGVYMSDYSVPRGVNKHELKVTFIDDESSTLKNYFKDWVDSYGDGQFVRPLGDPLVTRQVTINKLNTERIVIETNSYLVFPIGQMSFSGNSESNVITYPVTFHIAGKI